jgi:hypothetical protein
MKNGFFCLAGALVLAYCMSSATARADDTVDFVTQVKPILENSCVSCHSSDKPKGKLRLDTHAEAMKGGETGAAIVPGNSAKSLLYTTTMLPPDDDKFMPTKGPHLTPAQKDILKNWIDQGAKWPDDLTLKALKVIK